MCTPAKVRGELQFYKFEFLGEVKIFLISAGFPTGVENMGGGGAPQNLIFDGGGLKSKHGGA